MHDVENKYQRYTHDRDHISRISFYYVSSIKILRLKRRKSLWKVVYIPPCKSYFDPFVNLPKDSMGKIRYFTSWYSIFTIHSLHSSLQEPWEKGEANNTIRMARSIRTDRAWKTFEIVTDKEVSRGIKENWSSVKHLRQVHKDHFSKAPLSNENLVGS